MLVHVTLGFDPTEHGLEPAKGLVDGARAQRRAWAWMLFEVSQKLRQAHLSHPAGKRTGHPLKGVLVGAYICLGDLMYGKIAMQLREPANGCAEIQHRLLRRLPLIHPL